MVYLYRFSETTVKFDSGCCDIIMIDVTTKVMHEATWQKENSCLALLSSLAML